MTMHDGGSPNEEGVMKIEAAAKRAATEGRLTRLKRVIFAHGDEPVELVGYEVGDRPGVRRFVGTEPDPGPDSFVSEYRFAAGDVLLEEPFEE